MEVFSNCVNVISFIILLIVTGNNSAPNKNPDVIYKGAKDKFGELLTTIANINEKKLNALKEYTGLDSYKVGDGILRKIKNNRNVEKMAVLSDDNTKAILYHTLLDVICEGGISPNLDSYYNDMISRIEQINRNWNEILTLHDDYIKGIINEILREMICKNNRHRKFREATRLKHLDHRGDDSEPRDVSAESESARSDIYELKKRNALKQIIQSDNYAIFKEGDKNDDDHFDEIILVNDRHTKDLIYDVLYDMICRNGISPELNNYKSVIFGVDESKAYNELRMLNEENTKVMISKLLRRMICKNGRRYKIHKSNSPVAWLRHADHLIVDSNGDHFDVNDQMNKKSIENRYNSESNGDDDLVESKDIDSEEDEDNDNDNDRIDDSKALRSSCWKEATKNCKKACKYSVKDICDDYMCSKSMKKDFKKKCKRYCKEF